MINLALRTEYSFKKTFGKIKNIFKYSNGENYLGIADINGTYGHPIFEKLCKEKNIAPIFGVRLMVIEDKYLKTRGKYGPEYIFIAKNQKGLHEIYQLTKTSYDNFYYNAQLPFSKVLNITENVFVIAKNFFRPERIDYIALTPSTCKLIANYQEIPKVYINDNAYFEAKDKGTYQAFCGARKHGEGFRYLFEDQTYPQHILSKSESLRIWKNTDAIKNTYKIAEKCEATIPKAPMITFPENKNITDLCLIGAIEKSVPVDEEPYKTRFEKEIELIKEKNYIDYFLIVADAVKYAKSKMLVGPARGSAAGSLVCYLLSITEVDPIKHDLLFERFIDITRTDLPDIDIDFPDYVRQDVIKYITKKYGEKNVCHIANINKMRARSAIEEFGMALSIPRYEIDTVKQSIVERIGGDARAKLAAEDTLKTTEVGKELVKKYPNMLLALEAEDHCVHASVHAAGVIVCNEEITKFGGINSRDNSIMIDKKFAEEKNLLKIDFLGLRTLSILEEAAKEANLSIHHYYKLPLDDQKTFNLINEMRLSGIFQFEGRAMAMLCKQMGVNTFDDIVSITALCRPGPLQSGGANHFVKRRIGEEPADYLTSHETYIDATKATHGVIVYQEQLMKICKETGKMPWPEVQELRRAASKTLGKQFFDPYKNSFLAGAEANNIDQDTAVKIWEYMIAFGGWAMNKSHAVSYGYISYWCAYMKAHYPLEFAVATLNHSKSDDDALKILRDFVKNDGIEYTALDPDHSVEKWIIKDGKLLGGLINIKNVAEKKAKEIIKRRKDKTLTPKMLELLVNRGTKFDILFPCEHYYGDLFKNPQKYGLSKQPDVIANFESDASYLFIAKVIKKDLKDLNEHNEILKRGGQILDSNFFSLRLTVEDDTGQILSIISRYDFEKLDGKNLYENIIEDETWLIIRANFVEKWRIAYIKKVMVLPLNYCELEA